MIPSPCLLPRDLDPTGFTPWLEDLVAQLPEALCAVFVDHDGETIDLATRIDGFDARIAGAETAILLSRWRASAATMGQGPVHELRLSAGARTILARWVDDGCDLVLLTAAQGITAAAAERCATTAAALRAESRTGSSTAHPPWTHPPWSYPPWSYPPRAQSLLGAVEFRVSEAGRVLPRAFVQDGVWHRVAAVLGVQEEDGDTTFLLRTAAGEELLVRRDHHGGPWRRG